MTALQGWIVIGLAGVNHSWNSRHRCRDRIPALRMAYLQSITMLSCPAAASRRPGPSILFAKNPARVLLTHFIRDAGPR
jgi:hypothetical protein